MVEGISGGVGGSGRFFLTFLLKTLHAVFVCLRSKHVGLHSFAHFCRNPQTSPTRALEVDDIGSKRKTIFGIACQTVKWWFSTSMSMTHNDSESNIMVFLVLLTVYQRIWYVAGF